MIIPRQIFLRVPWGPFQLHKVLKYTLYTSTPNHIRCLAVAYGKLPCGRFACQSCVYLFTCFHRSFAFFIFITGPDDEDTDAAQLMSLPVLLQRSVLAPLLAQ